MIPILFDGTATDFTTNGLGRLSETVSCKVTEEKNGSYELELKYPISGKLFSQIQNEKIIVAVPFQGGSRQAFVIYEVNPDSNGTCAVKAQHISYRANYIPVLPFMTTGISNVVTALNTGTVPGTTGSRLPVANPFTLSTDIVNTSSLYQFQSPRSLRACLGGEDGSMLETFATKGTGEFEWDNFNIKFWNHRGSNTGYTCRYAKNVVSLGRTLDSTDLVTGVLPYWTDSYGEEGNSTYIAGDIQYASNHSSFPFEKIISVDFSDKFESMPTVSQLNSAGLSYVNDHNEISDEIQLDFFDIDNQAVHLCDTITVHYTKLGVSLTQKVIKTVWDVLLDRYDVITVGNDISSLDKTLIDANTEAKQYANSKALAVSQKVDYEVGLIQSSITSIEETVDTTLVAVYTRYTRTNGTRPTEPYSNYTWDYFYPPTSSTGNTIWSQYEYEYVDGDTTYSLPTAFDTSGVTITAVKMQYAKTANTQTTAPGKTSNLWQDTMPSVSENETLWTRYYYTYSNGTTDQSPGTNAMDAIFSSLYDVSDSLSNDISGINSDISGINSDISGINSDISGINSDISGINSDISGINTDISNLDTKIDNTKVSKVETRYAKTAANVTTAPANDSNLWGITYPTNVAVGEHIWQQTKTYYVDTTITPAYSTAVEVTERASSEKVTGVYVRYAKTASNVTTAPANDSSSWSTTYPSNAKTDEHVWEQVVTTYVTGNPSYSTATEIKDRGVANVVTQYATSTSSSTAPTSGWSDTFPSSIATGSYLWTRNKYLLADGSTVDHYSTPSIAQNNLVSSIATANSNASSAVSTANTANSNASAAVTTANTANSNASAAVTTANAANSNASAAVTTANAAASDASAAVSTANAASTTANNAATSAGLALRTVTVYYLKKTTTATPTSDDPDWSTTYPVQNFGDHIWTMTRYTYGNGSSGNSTPVEITENDVTGVKTQYALSTSNTTAPTSGWQDTMPAPEQNKYLWTRPVYTKSNGNTSNGTATLALNDLYAAVKGTLVDIETLYAVSAQSATTAPTSGWSETYPSYNTAKGKKVWTKVKYYYADGHTAESPATDITETGVMEVKTQYCLSTSNSTAPTTGWQDTMPTITVTNPVQYLWTREVYTLQNGTTVNGTATLAMNNIYSKIVSNDTRITEAETSINIHSGQITTITQSLDVNLTPFFSHDFEDVYNSSSNPAGYWQVAMPSTLAQDTDGWALFDASAADSYFAPVVDSRLDSGTLTLLIEIDSLNLADSTNKPYLRIMNGSNSQQYQSDSNFTISADGVYRIDITKSTITSPTRLVRGRINRGAAGNTFKIRLSLYLEGYTGPYAPTSEETMDAIMGLRSAISDVQSDFNIEAGEIRSSVSQVDSKFDNYYTKDDTNTKINSSITNAKSEIKQTTDKISGDVTRVEGVVNEYGETYEREVGAHFDFTATGLDIKTTESGFRGHFDSDSLDFLDGNNTRFGWVSAEEGVGGNQISIGDSTNKAKRWLIYPDTTGTYLRFGRHS